MRLLVIDENNSVITLTGIDSEVQVPNGCQRIEYDGPIPDMGMDEEIKKVLKWDGSKVVRRDKNDPVRIENAKRDKLEEIRREAQRIITEKWPLWEQLNLNAGSDPASMKDEKDQDIADVREASNIAEDEVEVATTIDEVEAVTPNWPSI